ncbi:MAG TPA: efflux RND transporter permease subunit, partial [Myxococcaceae bacterium]|nr:efflux RND transporter permease subunit [Myxococcaceae bacterium]
LVDDATVEVENFHRQRASGKALGRAILDSAAEIANPAFVSTLCICVVFLPVALISGAARSLFIPLALAVVFAMLTSYFLSRTLVPTLVRYLLRHEEHGRGLIARVSARVERGFEALRGAYARALASLLRHRGAFVLGFVAFVAVSLCLAPLLGRDFFPSVDAGQMRLHVRAPAGTRIEETQRLFAAVEERVRHVVPPDELGVVIDDIGVPVSGINLALGDPSMVSSADGEMLIALKPEHRPTAGYVAALRKDLSARFPDATFFFLPADLSTQVLDFGLSAPIDVRFTGPAGNQARNLELARSLASQMATIPGAVDVHLAQVTDTPALKMDVDRVAADDLGLNLRDVASDLLISLSSSSQTAPNFWMDPKTGVQYPVAVQTPQLRIDSLQALQTTPLAAAAGPQLVSNVAAISHATEPTNITHYNIARTLDVQAGVEGMDLGSVATAVRRKVAALQLPRGTRVEVTGQPQAMDASFQGLGFGILGAILLVYLLMAVNFQSWLQPAVILSALPGALAGIVWALFLTRTPLSVPALMGALMSVGVATANSILVVTFAVERMREGVDAVTAALEAGRTRLRPVIMTATAMVLGMLPMSLGLGDGGEQNAPLGRAVIGGLVFATLGTLVFVPAVLSAMRYRPPEPLEGVQP